MYIEEEIVEVLEDESYTEVTEASEATERDKEVANTKPILRDKNMKQKGIGCTSAEKLTSMQIKQHLKSDCCMFVRCEHDLAVYEFRIVSVTEWSIVADIHDRR